MKNLLNISDIDSNDFKKIIEYTKSLNKKIRTCFV